MNTNLKIRVKDRIGLVNEITTMISDLGITILKHDANVISSKGMEISSFNAKLYSEDYRSFALLKRKCEKIKGLVSFSFSDFT